MLSDIKKMLLENPESIVDLLETYDFCHIHQKNSEIRFARNDEGGQNISIRLQDNDGLFVKDFVTNNNEDIVGYIMQSRGIRFVDVLKEIKKILSLDDSWGPSKKSSIFGGFYDGIGVEKQVVCKEYPESVMDKYDKIGNKRWLRDGIPLSIQRKYNVCYDKDNDLIVFPWRSATTGAIISVKARINYQREDDGLKYWYVVNGAVSNSLFGYSENYDALMGCDRLFVVESEKTTMILDGWGIRTSVALGSHSLSEQQARLIMSLYPREVWFMLDKDLPLEETQKNIKTLREYMMMKNCKIKYWNWTHNTTVCEKGAPVDMGKYIFDDVCKHEMEVAEWEK